MGTRVVVVLLLILEAANHQVSASTPTDSEGRLYYRLMERQPVDTLVADVAGDTRGGGARSTGARYLLINNNDPASSMFHIDHLGLYFN